MMEHSYPGLQSMIHHHPTGGWIHNQASAVHIAASPMAVICLRKRKEKQKNSMKVSFNKEIDHYGCKKQQIRGTLSPYSQKTYLLVVQRTLSAPKTEIQSGCSSSYTGHMLSVTNSKSMGDNKIN